MLDACVFAIMCSLSGLKLIIWCQCFRKVPTGTKFTGHLPPKVLLVRTKSSYIAKRFFSFGSVRKSIHFSWSRSTLFKSKTVLKPDWKERVFFQDICNGISTITFLFSLSLSFVSDFIQCFVWKCLPFYTFSLIIHNETSENAEMIMKKFLCELDLRNAPTMFLNENVVAWMRPELVIVEHTWHPRK